MEPSYGSLLLREVRAWGRSANPILFSLSAALILAAVATVGAACGLFGSESKPWEPFGSPIQAMGAFGGIILIVYFVSEANRLLLREKIANDYTKVTAKVLSKTAVTERDRYNRLLVFPRLSCEYEFDGKSYTEDALLDCSTVSTEQQAINYLDDRVPGETCMVSVDPKHPDMPYLLPLRHG